MDALSVQVFKARLAGVGQPDVVSGNPAYSRRVGLNQL